MAAPVISDQEFIELYEEHGAKGLSKLIGMGDRSIQQRRVRLERKYRRHITNPNAWPSVGKVIKLEFPDWQEMEIKNGYLICFGDAHLEPGEKTTAHKALLKFIKELQPEALVDLGDLVDFSTISRHHRIGWDKHPEVGKEIEWAGDCLDEMKKLGPKRMITKKCMGNHDMRFSGYFSNLVPKMEGVKGTAYMDHFPGWGVSWSIRVNSDQLEITHRWKSGLHGPWNNTLWAGISYVTGHQHKQQIYPLTDLRGDRWGVDSGTLASIYAPTFRYLEGKPRNWRSGFAVFRFVNGKLRYPELLRVIDEQKGLVEWRGQDINV
jgi:hypothetical protein